MKTAVVFLVLLTTLAVSGQDLPSNFEYKRETGPKTGVPMFSLSTNNESVTYDAIEGNPFEALLLEVQPERGKYGLLYVNAKPRRSLLFGKSKSCSMKIDGDGVSVKVLQGMPPKRLSRLLVEYMILQIDREVFEQLVTANDVFVKCGNVGYSLDQDNIDALHWFGAEITRDLKRRAAKPQ
jgi:hypothetical protein